MVPAIKRLFIKWMSFRRRVRNNASPQAALTAWSLLVQRNRDAHQIVACALGRLAAPILMWRNARVCRRRASGLKSKHEIQPGDCCADRRQPARRLRRHHDRRAQHQLTLDRRRAAAGQFQFLRFGCDSGGRDARRLYRLAVARLRRRRRSGPFFWAGATVAPGAIRRNWPRTAPSPSAIAASRCNSPAQTCAANEPGLRRYRRRRGGREARRATQSVTG